MQGPPRPFKVVIVQRTKHSLVFDVQWLPPKFAIALTSVMTYDVPTLKIELPAFSSLTNTVMDYQQMANRLGHVPLDSRCAHQFNYVSECDCESGGPCCETTLEMHVTNETSDELKVWSDDLISADPRVRPVHRTFAVTSIWNTSTGVGIETDEPNSFDVGSLVTALDSVCVPPLPQYLKVAEILSPQQCVLVHLLPKARQVVQVKTALSYQSTGSMVAHVSNRQLFYYMAPKDMISVKAIVRKGTGRQHIKWSATTACHYRPLFRNMKPPRARLTPDQAASFAQVCPKNVFDIEDSGLVSIARPDECDACRRCERWAEDNQVADFVQLPKNKWPEWQRFTVETNGSLDAIDVVRQAFQIIQTRLTGRSQEAGGQLAFPALPHRK